MARSVSQATSKKPIELRATQGLLDQRWIELTRLLALTLGLSIDGKALRVDVEYQAKQVWAGLQGTECERVTRNRGGSTFVAPLCDVAGGMKAWLGWQESWEVATGAKPYRFRNAGLTIYLGKPNEAVKPQILRLEWPGISNWSHGEVSFQSPGAGHPHWQFDALQTLADGASEVGFEPSVEEIVEDFEALHAEPTTFELLQRFSINRMHFASAAPWWLPVSADGIGHHVNAPPDLPSLSRWLEQSLLYLKQELSRCVVSP